MKTIMMKEITAKTSMIGVDFIESDEQLTFDEMQLLNEIRNKIGWKKRRAEFGMVDWSNAIAGEAGELCNWVKKYRRGDFNKDEARAKILSECADVIAYAQLMISFLKSKTSITVATKFNEVSIRPEVNFPQIWLRDPKSHAPWCQQREVSDGAVSVECKHGYDCCPECDPCTCTKKDTPQGEYEKTIIGGKSKKSKKSKK